MSFPHKNIGHVSFKVKVCRMIWNVVYYTLFKTCPTKLLWPWRWWLLKIFGAKVSFKALVYSSVEIWAPWNLRMEDYSCLGPHVICYNQDVVELEERSVVSQYSFLCTAGHNSEMVNNAQSGLIIAPIKVHRFSWIGVRSYINMGVEIGEYAIVGATASVYKDVAPYSIVGGNPAQILKMRTMKPSNS